MIECLESLPLHFNQVFKYSGKSLNSLGQYNQCLQSQGMVYNLAYVSMREQQQSMIGQIGLCLPKQCEGTSIKYAFDQLFEFIHYPLEISYVNNSVQDFHYENNWAFYLVISITIAVMVLITISTWNKQTNLLTVFSLKETKKVFQRNPKSRLNVLNGIKSISMMWVVLGHTISTLIGQSVNLQSSVESTTLLTPFFLFVEGGFFSVDVFFFVAGFLLAYIFLKQKQNALSSYPLTILNRVLRFWPSYFFAILVYYGIYLHLGSGPNWGQDKQLVQYCSQMWKSLFFVDNLIDNGEKMCMGWGWYLQNDMQLFVLSILLLFVYHKSQRLSKSLTLLFTLASLVWTFLWTYQNQIVVITHLEDGGKWNLFFNDVYIKPWARAPPYLIGLFLGILYSQFIIKEKNQSESKSVIKMKSSFLLKFYKLLKNKKAFLILTETTGIILMLFLILIPRTLQLDLKWPQWVHSSYNSLAKFFFVLSLFLAILPSLLDCKNSFVKSLLDTNIFNFVAKISFCTYLLHLNVIFVWFYNRTYTRYFTITPALPQYFAILIISLFFGFLMTIMIEIPFSKLQKNLIKLLKSKLMAYNSERKTQLEQNLNINKSLISISTQSNQILTLKQ